MSSGDVPWSSISETGEVFEEKHPGLRFVVILTCSLSILGSLVIVFSYAFFKHLRGKPREILLHISLMDFGVSLANLIGAAVYFDQYYHRPGAAESSDDNFTASPSIEAFCKTQAFFAGYFTLCSVLWTVFLSVYIYLFLIYHKSRPELPHYSLHAFYLVGYGLPLIIVLWLVLTGRLGYAPYNSSGWCSLIVKNPATGENDYFVAVMGNDLWIYLAMFLITLLYIASSIFIHWQLESSLRKEHHRLVYKFLCVPVVFMLLRFWTCVLIILYTYVGLDETDVPSWINELLIFLAGIGDSGQGFANAILFALFSHKVRSGFQRWLCCRRQVMDISCSDETLLGRSLENSSMVVENPLQNSYHESTCNSKSVIV